MFCSECGKNVEEGAVFCPDCGAKVISGSSETVSTGAAIKRPMSLMYVVFYSAFSGLLTLGVAVAGLIAAGITTGMGAHVTVAQGFLLLFLLLIGISFIVAAYGLWNIIEWGRKLTIAVYAISIPLNVVGLFGKGVSAGMVVIYLWSIAICVGVIYYLTRPKVKKLFTW